MPTTLGTQARQRRDLRPFGRDALSGGALLGHVMAPLVLVGTSSVPGSVTTYLAGVRGTITTGYLFGGPNTVNQSVEDAINITLGG